MYGNTFHTPTNPLDAPPLEPHEVSAINASFYIAGLVGTVFLTLMGDVFGRKYTLMVLCVPQMVNSLHGIFLIIN